MPGLRFVREWVKGRIEPRARASLAAIRERGALARVSSLARALCGSGGLDGGVRCSLLLSLLLGVVHFHVVGVVGLIPAANGQPAHDERQPILRRTRNPQVVKGVDQTWRV